MELLIYHHLGLGDHIICNGLVNHIADNYDKVRLLCKTAHKPSVVFLYRNNPKITVVDVPDNAAAGRFFESFPGQKLRLGFDYLKQTRLLFDEAFYAQAGIPFSERWDRFSLGRDRDAERALFETFHVREGQYVFVHDDAARNYVLNRKYVVNNNLQIVSFARGSTQNIFDYCYLIENATEIHCMDSSFKQLADSLLPNARLLYHHLYVRGKDRHHVSSSRLKWEQIYFSNLLINSWSRRLRGREGGS